MLAASASLTGSASRSRQTSMTAGPTYPCAAGCTTPSCSADPEPDPRLVDEIVIQLGERVPQRAEQADDEARLVDRAAGRQQRQAAVALLLELVLAGREADLAERELEDIDQPLLGGIFAPGAALAIVLNVVSDA